MPAETSRHPLEWVLIALVAVAIVLLLAWARREPGFDDRVPDPEDAHAALLRSVDDAGGV